MKNLRIIFSTLMLCALSLSIGYAESLDGIAAYVNNDVIPVSQVNQQFNLIKQQIASTQMASSDNVPSDREIKQKILQQLIDQSLQLQRAKEAGIKIDEATLDKAVATIAARNHMSVDQLKHAIAQQGVNYSDYREELRKQLIVDRLEQSVVQNTISVTPEEVDRYLNNANQAADLEYQVSDLVVSLPNHPSADQISAVKASANQVLQKIHQGGKFNSTDLQAVAGKNAQLQENDLGWRALSDLPDIFSKQVKSLKVGEVSSLIQAPNGFHILKLEATRPKGNATSITRQQAQQAVYEDKFNKAVADWLKKVRAASYIKIVAQN